MKKRADGRYCKQIQIGYHSDGRRKMKTVYGKTIKEVERKEREFLSLIDGGMRLDSDSLTLSEWSQIWLKTYKQDVAYNTKHMYNNVISTHIIPAIGYLKITKIKPTHIQMFLNDLISAEHRRTASVCKMTLNQIFNQAVVNDIIVKNPVKDIKPVNYNVKEKIPLTQKQMSVIFNADWSQKQKIFLYLITFMGLRKGEALALTKDDICQENNMLSVNKSLYFEENTPRIKAPKSQAGYRNLPIPELIQAELYEYCNQCNNEIFTMTNGNPMTKSSFRKFWDGIMKVVKGLGCEAFSAHICRHTYCTTLYYSGVKVKTAQYLMGHSSLNMTLGVYTHLDNNATQKDVQKLNEYITQELQISC